MDDIHIAFTDSFEFLVICLTGIIAGGFPVLKENGPFAPVWLCYGYIATAVLDFRKHMAPD